MDEIRVSVVMTSYNGEKWIEEQIASILTQISPNDELIICDDGSQDATCAIIASFDDPRISLSINTTSLGPWENSIKALSKAQNEIIMVCDQDDIWLPHKYTTLLAAFTPQVQLILHDAEVITGEGEILFSSYFAQRGVRHGVIANILKNSYTGCFMALRRSFLQSIRTFPSSVPYDQWIGLMAEKEKSALHLATPLVRWRRHNATVTHPFSSHHQPLYQVFVARLRLFFLIVSPLKE